MCLPNPISAREAELSTRQTLVLKAATSYLQDCKKSSNLTPAERRGLKIDFRRVKAGEYIVAMTDKSGKLCVVSKEFWDAMGEEHIGDDEDVKLGDVQAAQRRVNGHLHLLNNILRPGYETTQEDRVHDAKEQTG